MVQEKDGTVLLLARAIEFPTSSTTTVVASTAIALNRASRTWTKTFEVGVSSYMALCPAYTASTVLPLSADDEYETLVAVTPCKVADTLPCAGNGLLMTLP